MGKIYRITNTVNGMVYIGQTTKSIKHRFAQHANSGSKCKKMRDAIAKFGKDKFTIEHIASTLNDNVNALEFCIELERAVIKQYDSVMFGYNSEDTSDAKRTRYYIAAEERKTFIVDLLNAKVPQVRIIEAFKLKYPAFPKAYCKKIIKLYKSNMLLTQVVNV